MALRPMQEIICKPLCRNGGKGFPANRKARSQRCDRAFAGLRFTDLRAGGAALTRQLFKQSC